MPKSNTNTTVTTKSTKTSPTKGSGSKTKASTRASPKSGSKVAATKPSTKSPAKKISTKSSPKASTKSSPKTVTKASPAKKPSTKSPAKTVTKKTKRTSETKPVSSPSTTELITEIRIALQENYVEQKRLVARLEGLLKLEPSPKARGTTQHTDFSTPELVPKPLAKLLDLDANSPLSKYQVTQKLYKYLGNKGLIDNKTKEIVVGKRLRRTLGMDDADTLDFYNMQSWIRKVYEASAHTDQRTSIEV
ncbi:Hypothetical protein MVR_LOCUS219 [uncultured virus]|nr:Hypothetical protein MVR_LOCUS219 [uncultured virus]